MVQERTSETTKGKSMKAPDLEKFQIMYILRGHDVEHTTDVRAWEKMFKNTKTRQVAESKTNDVWVSTVFLGFDHNWGDGPPLLFETMVFGGKLDQEQKRYSTWDEAVRGHAAIVERVRKGNQ